MLTLQTLVPFFFHICLLKLRTLQNTVSSKSLKYVPVKLTTNKVVTSPEVPPLSYRRLNVLFKSQNWHAGPWPDQSF